MSQGDWSLNKSVIASLDGRWHPGIGDPTPIGWITVVAYGSAALLCFWCQRKSSRGDHRQFWWFMALVMVLLGINKQLDLQTWFTEVGRDMAREQGWYVRRQWVQMVFIAWLLLAALTVRGWLAKRLVNLDQYARRAGIGLLLLMVFVIIRAASFHHIDRLLGMSLQGMRFNAVLELCGIGVIAFAACGRLAAFSRIK